MLVYLKLYLFSACNQNRHNECQGADMFYDTNGDVQVKACTCTCHENPLVPKEKTDETLRANQSIESTTNR